MLQSRNQDYTDPQTFDVSGRKFTSACQEATVKGNQAMICLVVGTRLEFSYLGSKKYEPVARNDAGFAELRRQSSVCGADLPGSGRQPVCWDG